MSRGAIDSISDNLSTMSISKVRYDNFIIAEKQRDDLFDLIEHKYNNKESISLTEIDLLYKMLICPTLPQIDEEGDAE